MAPVPSPPSCLPAERQRPQLGVSDPVIAQGVQGSRSRKAQAEQGWVGAKAAAYPPPVPLLSPDIRERQKLEGLLLSERPLLSMLGASLWVQNVGFGAGESIFLYYYVCATVALSWHYCNYNKVLVPSAVCLSVRPSWVMCVL